MQTGAWTVEVGEHLFSICRQLIGGEKLGACVEEIRARNPTAFFNGDPARLIPGAMLQIPPSLRKGAGAASTKSSPPSARAPGTLTPLSTDASPVASDVPIVVKPDVAKYRDVLIDAASTGPDPVDDGPALNTEPGQRFTSVEYSADIHQQQSRGRVTDQSVALQFRQETENWGEWFVDAAGMHTTGPLDTNLLGARSGGRATIYHNAFPVTESWMANSAFGVVRNSLNTLVANSFRLTLPSPLFAGLATQIGDETRDFRLAAGNIGVLRGYNSNAFDTTRGQFASASATLRLGDGWLLGAQSMQVRDVLLMPDHASLAAVLHRELPGQAGKWSIHALADSKGQRGAWADADVSWDVNRHRFGVFHLDPRLLWADAQIANDQRGFYWRIDQRALRQSFFGGINYTDSNLDRIASRGGQKSADGFVHNQQNNLGKYPEPSRASEMRSPAAIRAAASRI